MITKTTTETYSEILCSSCGMRVDFNTNCLTCGCRLIEPADWKEGQEIWCLDGEEGHFCSQECADNYARDHLKKEADVID